MRKSGLLVLALLVFSATPTFAQSISSWMLETSPTARVWAMGFAGGASSSTMPALYSPGTVGLWALNGAQLMYTHNQSWQGPKQFEQIGFENDFYAIALQMPEMFDASIPRLSVGVLRRSGHTNLSYGTSRKSYDDWSFGFGLDLGVEIGLGWNYFRSSLPGSAATGEWKHDNGGAIRARLNHILQRFSHGSVSLRYGPYVVDPSVTLATNEHIHTTTSWAVGIGVQRGVLPLADVEYVIDTPADADSYGCRTYERRRYGWEVMAFGTVAYRWGTRDECADGSVGDDPLPDWTMDGWAIDAGNALRWARQMLKFETPPTLTWILDHLDIRYETASFRHPEFAPTGLDDWSVKEWAFGLSNIQRFWSSEP